MKIGWRTKKITKKRKQNTVSKNRIKWMRQEKQTHHSNHQESKRRERVFNCSAVINGSISRDRCNAAGYKNASQPRSQFVFQLLQPQQTEYKHNNIEAVIDRYWMVCRTVFCRFGILHMYANGVAYTAHSSV